MPTPATMPRATDRRTLPRCTRCVRRRVAFATAIYCRTCADVMDCAATGGSVQHDGDDEGDA